MEPIGSRANKSSIFRRPLVFWTGSTCGARWATPSERQRVPASLTDQQHDYQVWLHRSWLWQGGVDGAIKALRNLGTGLPAEPLETVNEAITYLENQRGWIGSYEQWQKMGYPVGSGMIERAVAIVINRRMKKRGMRWCRPNATAVVALRTDVLNEDWILPQHLRCYP